MRKIQLTNIIAQTTIHCQSQRDLPLHFLLNIMIYLVIEKLLPTHTLFGIRFKHFSYYIFTQIWNVVDGPRKFEILLRNHCFELIDIFSIIGRSSKKHPVITNSQRIHICLVTVLQIVQNLRSHIEWTTKHSFS